MKKLFLEKDDWKIINGVFQSIEKQTYEVDIKSYGLFALNEKLNNHTLENFKFLWFWRC